MQKDSINVLHDLMALLRRRFLILLIVLLVVVSIAVFLTFNSTPIYRSMARLQVEPEDLIFKTTDQSIRKLSLWEYYFETHAQVLTSTSFCSRVIERLPENLKEELLASHDPTGSFLANLHVQTQKKSLILDVSYQGTSPESITIIVNTVADTYASYVTEEYRARQVQKAIIIENKTLPELLNEAERLRLEHVEFQRKHGFQDLEQEHKQQKQLIDRLNDEITTMDLKIRRLESQYKTLTALDTTYDERLLDMEMIKGDSMIRDLRSERHRLEKEYEKKSIELGNEHPNYKELVTELNKVKKDLENIVLNKMSAARLDLEMEINRMKGDLQLLKNDLAEKEGKLADVNALVVESDGLKAKYEGKKELCDFLMKQLGLTALGQQEILANVKVIDHARVPSIPFKPNKVFNITVGTILGLFLGLLAALYVDYLDNSVKSAEDVEQITGPVPILCEIPLIHSERMNLPESGPVLFTESGEPNAFEAFRKLRVEFLIRAQRIPVSATGAMPQSGNCKVVLVISSQMSEGKTTVALNLANSLRLDGKKVLLIDSDLRNPCLLNIFGDERRGDLIEFFKDQSVKPEELVVDVAGFWLIGLSMPISSSTELIGSKRFDELISWSRANYEYVVIDSPPLLLTADSAVIAQKSDCVILVTRQHQTRRIDLKTAIKQLQGEGVNILGCVFNCVDKFSSKYYSYYYYDYGSRKRGRRRVQTQTSPVERLERKDHVFNITINTAQTQVAPTSEHSVYALGPIKELNAGVEKLKVLIVEDDRSSRDLLKNRMQEGSLRPPEFEDASSGYEAVEMAKSLVPDLILMDLRIPGKDAFEVIREIRRDSRLIKTVIVAFGAEPVEDARRRAIASGADAFIEKPQEISNLNDVVMEIFTKKHIR